MCVVDLGVQSGSILGLNLYEVRTWPKYVPEPASISRGMDVLPVGDKGIL